MANEKQNDKPAAPAPQSWQEQYLAAVSRLEFTGTGKPKIEALHVALKELQSKVRGQPSLEQIKDYLDGKIPAPTLGKFLHLLEHGIPDDTGPETIVAPGDFAALKDALDRVVTRQTADITTALQRIALIEGRLERIEAALQTLRAPAPTEK